MKFIEWAFEPGDSSHAAGLYRREIKPTASDLIGKEAWALIEPFCEGIQFNPVTVASTGTIVHNRTMTFTSNSSQDGIEDIRGASVSFVIRGPTERKSGRAIDNPLTATVETDLYPRLESNFYIENRNSLNRN